MEESNPFRILELWLNIAFVMSYLPFIVGLVRFRKLTHVQRLIWALAVTMVVNENITYFLRLRSQDNLWVFHLFIPVLTYIMFEVFKVKLTIISQKMMNVVMVIAILFSFLNSLVFQDLKSFNSNAIVLSSSLFICLAILYFAQLIINQTIQSPNREPMVWFNSGVLLHYSGTLLLFLFVNSLEQQSTDVMMASWAINIALTILLLILNSVALWIKPQK